MLKSSLVLLCLLAAWGAGSAHAAPGDSGSTTGWQDNSVNQALAEEFAKCAAFSDVAAECVQKDAQKSPAKSVADYEDAVKRFYKGGYMLAGQNFAHKRLQFHNTSMRRSAGAACEDFPRLVEQYDKRCDDTARRLPRALRRP